jgi:hypothetical protein
MDHQPCFNVRTHCSESADDQWIYDGDQPICLLEHRTVDEPEQNLRYFDSNPRPINLRDLVLSPGGRPLVAGVQMYWVMKHRVLACTELVSVTFDGDDTDTLKLTVVTRPFNHTALSRRVMTLTYDPSLGSYIYDFECHLELSSPEIFDTWERICFEYCDPWYVDTPAPTVAFTGMWQCPYTHFVAQGVEGTQQMPFNHMATRIMHPRAMQRGGLFVAGFNPGGNPAFEFIGDTADRTSIGICNWSYDVHLHANYSSEQLRQPICERFRVRLCPDETVQQLLSQAQPVLPIERLGCTELPLYERSTSFEKALVFNEPSPGELDAWPWSPLHDGATWCKGHGRDDDYSLKISKDTVGPCEWRYEWESEGCFTQRWHPTTGFRVTGYIKTENVSEQGVCLALRWWRHNYEQRFAYVCSKRLTGNNDWTKVQVEIKNPPPRDQADSLAIYFRQDGSGVSWLDDLEVEIL